MSNLEYKEITRQVKEHKTQICDFAETGDMESMPPLPPTLKRYYKTIIEEIDEYGNTYHKIGYTTKREEAVRLEITRAEQLVNGQTTYATVVTLVGRFT